jgi:hypothetical protein
MFLFLALASCNEKPELPERAFAKVVLEGSMGPCSCPLSSEAKSVSVHRMNNDAESPVTITKLNGDCEVQTTYSGHPPGNIKVNSHGSGAWGIDGPATEVACPGTSEQAFLLQWEASCPTTFRNDLEVGPKSFSLIPNHLQSRSISVQAGSTLEMDCGGKPKAYAPGWHVTDQSSVVEDGKRLITLSWESAPTLSIQVQDRSGQPIAYETVTTLGQQVVTDAEGRVTFGHTPGLAMLFVGTPPQPSMLLHRGGDAERTLETNLHPAVVVHHSARERSPECLLGPQFSCASHDIQNTTICRCEADKDGTVPLLWSGGVVRVPEGVDRIALDTSSFDGEVLFSLEGGSFTDVQIKAVGAPQVEASMGNRVSPGAEHGLRFTDLAPGRYQLMSGFFLPTAIGPEFEVSDGPVDIGTIVLD